MGRLLVLEGLDGSGKSTQTECLKQTLEAAGQPLRQIKLPDYDHPSSALVKQYLAGDFGSDPAAVNAYAASSFYAVDRVASFLLDWKADYEAGTLVLADRYTTSNPIYQMTKLPKEDWAAYLSWVKDFEYGKLELPEPDLVIFLDMPVEVSQKMMTDRYKGDEGKKDVHEKNIRFLEACREAALYTAEQWGWSVVPCAEGDAPRSIASIAEEVYGLSAKLIGTEACTWQQH